MRCLLPLAFDRYMEGKSLTFGPLSVDVEGLTHGKSFLPWGEVNEVKLAMGMFTVTQKGKWLSWCKIGVASLPNLFVLLALVDNIVGVQR